MPVRNVVKQFGADQYYHVYSRGVNKRRIFYDNDDYDFFVSLFARYLSERPILSPARVKYPHFGNRLDLLAFCVMPNHVHLLVYQYDQQAMTEFMRALMTSYSIYFNKKYDRRGPLFESNYLASLVDKESYLQHITRYIHLNPKEWQNYRYSSLGYYLGDVEAEWLRIAKIMSLFNNNRGKYLNFVRDYTAQKQLLDSLKHQMAHL